MIHKDAIYGEFKVPDFVSELTNTAQVQRLKGISQDVLPNGLMPWGMPSRYEHSLGVVRLAAEVLQDNALEDSESLVLVSALLHDAGNPALSHLAEPFLKELTGKDGESFLEEMLRGSEAERIVKSLGLSTGSVVQMVTGKSKPLAKFLNGSVDVDNIDNVNRYWFAVHNEVRFDAIRLARAFLFDGEEWTLKADSYLECQKWRETRELVYGGIIYGEPHLSACQMLYRAVVIAFERGELAEPFFRLADSEAVQCLTEKNDETAYLARRALARSFYELVYDFKTDQPSSKFVSVARQPQARHELANFLAV